VRAGPRHARYDQVRAAWPRQVRRVDGVVIVRNGPAPRSTSAHRVPRRLRADDRRHHPPAIGTRTLRGALARSCGGCSLRDVIDGPTSGPPAPFWPLSAPSTCRRSLT